MEDQRRSTDAPKRICPLPLDESFFVALFNGIVEAVFAIDLDTRRIVYWNSGAERMFGYGADEALRRTTEFLQPDRVSFDRIHHLAVPDIGEQGFWRGDWSYRRRDGSIFPAEVTATMIRSQASTAMNVVVVVRDVTGRKELESQIYRLNREIARRVTERTSELTSARNELAEAAADKKITAEQFRLLIDGVRDYAILMLDVGGRIMSWNSGATRIFGYQEDEIIGKPFSLFYADADARIGKSPEALKKATAEGSLDERARLLRRDGSRIDADVIIAPFRDAAAELTNYSMIIRDVTERVAIRQKLREKEHLATIGTTMSMFAHEVSNPLNSIATSIQLLERTIDKDEFPAKKPAISSLNDLNIEIRRLRSLLDEFRTLARPAALNLRSLDLANLVVELIKVSSANFVQAKVQVSEDFPSPLPLVKGDPDKLKQALLNLLINAVEAMPQGGRIVIKGYERGADVCLEIMDTGVGIPEGSKIFDFFHTTKPGGTGLGLVIVQQIIAAHDGSITYTSQPGSGTTFHLTFPSASFLKNR